MSNRIDNLTSTLADEYPTPLKFIGRPINEIPTPSLVLSRPILERNAAQVHNDVAEKGLSFRPHLKTLKCSEATKIMLGNGKHTKVVVSTLREIRGLKELVQDGSITEILYGFPVPPNQLPELISLSRLGFPLILLLDHPAQLAALESTVNELPPWSVFIKIDAAYQRAGIPVDSPRLQDLVNRVLSSPSANLKGFYAHAGHSYAATTSSEAAGVMDVEVKALLEALNTVPAPNREHLVLSFGSTPAAHVMTSLKKEVPPGIELEIHAGNFVANDLQQVSTGAIAFENQALRVVAEVASVYPERNEALVNAGVLALTREVSGRFNGFARVAGKEGWYVKKISQEHGVLAVEGDGKVEEAFEVGEKVMLFVAHACITAAGHYWYYVVDEEEVVREVWYPWKGW